MPIVAQKCLEAIRLQVDLADAIAPYVQLKRAGKSWKGLSPFTQEKTPSFYVHPEKGFYKCFSTGKGGDIFNFYMEVENLAFGEAVEFIARRFSIPLEYESGGPAPETLSLRRRLFDLHEFAAEWFHEQFLTSAEAAPVRDYWQTQRGFSLEVAKRHKIGYASASKQSFLTAIDTKRFPIDALAHSGLFFGGEKERSVERLLARFRGRLMIPIRDVQGRVVAFTARQLEQTPEDDPARDAKYVNSPETLLFHKSKILFGLDHARSHHTENGSFLLVEGQLDAIRCWDCGLNTAVAPQGTALTEDQLHLLRRYSPSKIEVLLDGDKAGRNAALRAIPMALKVGLELSFLPLPEKADPDDLLRTQGAEAIENLRQQARAPLPLLIESLLPDDGQATAQDKARCLQTIYEYIHPIDSAVVREDLLRQATRLLGSDYGAVQRDYNAWTKKNQRVQPSARTSPDGSVATGSTHETFPAQQDAPQLLTSAESELLWLLFNFPEYAESVSQIIEDEWIDLNTPNLGAQLLVRLLAETREGLYRSADDITGILETSEEQAYVAGLRSKDLAVEEPEILILNCITRIHRKFVRKALETVNQRILNADRSNGEDLQLMRQRRELYNQLNLELNLGNT